METECGKRNYFPFKRKNNSPVQYFFMWNGKRQWKDSHTRSDLSFKHGWIDTYIFDDISRRVHRPFDIYLPVSFASPSDIFKFFRSPVSSSHISPASLLRCLAFLFLSVYILVFPFLLFIIIFIFVAFFILCSFFTCFFIFIIIVVIIILIIVVIIIIGI